MREDTPAPVENGARSVTAAEEAQMALCQLSWIEDGGEVHPRRIECIKTALERLSKSGPYEELSVAHFLSKTAVERELRHLKSGSFAHQVRALLKDAGFEVNGDILHDCMARAALSSVLREDK